MSDAVPAGTWVAGLSPHTVGAALVQPVEGTLRLCAVATAPATPDPTSAVVSLGQEATSGGTASPAAVVVDALVPLRIAAFAPRQELYDRILRPAVSAFGCTCSGGGLDTLQDRRPGTIEGRLQQALDAQPDVLLIWDDGSETVQRWRAALESHAAEAWWRPPGAASVPHGAELRREPALLVVHASAATAAAAAPTRLAPWQLVWPGTPQAGALHLWRALADLWRDRASEGWRVGDVAPRLRTETLLWAARFLAAHYGAPVVLCDLDLAQVVIYTVAGAEVRIQRVPHGGSDVATVVTWARGCIPGLDAEQLAALVERRWRGIPPADAAALDLELVLAAGRQGLLSAAPPNARLVATGRLAAQTADPARIGAWLLEAVRPQGCGLLCWDDANALSLLAALAPTLPAVAETILADGGPPLGTYLVAGYAQQAAPLAIERPDGTVTELVAPSGDLNRLPLQPGERATIQAGVLGTLSAQGGPLGLVLDSRARQREASLRSFSEAVAALRRPDRAAEALA